MESNGKRIQAVYAVVSKTDGRDLFLRVGNAFPNRDGSTTLLLDAMPISGKLHVRDYLPNEARGSSREPSKESPSARSEAEDERLHGASSGLV